MIEERRNAVRLRIFTPVRYQQKGSQRFGNLLSQDVSSSGIGFVSTEFFPVSTHLILEFKRPTSNEFLRTIGEIVWISSRPYSEEFSVGARFIEPLKAI